MPGPNRGAGPAFSNILTTLPRWGRNGSRSSIISFVRPRRATFKMPANHILQVVVTDRHRIGVAMADRHRRRHSPLSYSG